MVLGSGPIWIYEEEQILLNASPGVVKFAEKNHGLFPYLIPIVLFLFGALIFAGFVDEVLIYNYEKIIDEDSDEPCWPEWDDRIVLTNGTYMCITEWNTFREDYSNFKTSDNHYKFDQWEETYEYRWSEQDGYLFISYIPPDRDHYECSTYIRESSLPKNLTGDEFWYYYLDTPDFPDWCEDEDPRNVNPQYISNSSIPFNGEKFYDVYESSGELYGISFQQFTDDEQIMSEYYYEGEVTHTYFTGVLGPAMMSAPIFFGRKKRYVIDTNNSIFTTEFVSFPHLPKMKKLAKPFEMYLTNTTKEIHHSNEDGGSRTSYHNGMELSIADENGDLIDVIFFLSDNAKKEFKQTLEKIEFVTETTFGNSSDEK
tara:strand:+ start:1272 stop:2381 length:1110 start_codon:yes stop_codon:yes gene_type:complete